MSGSLGNSRDITHTGENFDLPRMELVETFSARVLITSIVAIGRYLKKRF
jgi:hypothetical protein